ncbi:MAG: IS1595 family transposase [Caldilineaceae bacterium]
MFLKIHELIDDAKCYETLRTLRWPAGVHSPHCGLPWVKKRGFHTHQPARQRYCCQGCEQQFDDLTGTPLAGHHQPVKVWMLCLSFMGLNLSNQQIAQELDLNKDDAHAMTTFPRQALYAQRQPPLLEGEVEFDEVYLVAGHKGQPAAWTAAGRSGRRHRLKAQRGRGTLATEKPPVLGMMQRTGQLIIEMLSNVQQKTIQPLIQAHVRAGALIYTDEYNIYGRLAAWGFDHKTVNHSLREFARDEMATVSMKCIPTRLKAFGRSSVLGCVPIAGFLRISSRFIWLSLSLFTMSGNAARLFWLPFYPFS